MRGTRAKALRKAGLRTKTAPRSAENATPTRIVRCRDCGRSMTVSVEDIGRSCRQCSRREANRLFGLLQRAVHR